MGWPGAGEVDGTVELAAARINLAVLGGCSTLTGPRSPLCGAVCRRCVPMVAQRAAAFAPGDGGYAKAYRGKNQSREDSLHESGSCANTESVAYIFHAQDPLPNVTQQP